MAWERLAHTELSSAGDDIDTGEQMMVVQQVQHLLDVMKLVQEQMFKDK